MEQVAHIDPEFRRFRTERAEAFIAGNALGIADLQQKGIAEPEVDPLTTSRSLSSMVSHLGPTGCSCQGGRRRRS